MSGRLLVGGSVMAITVHGLPAPQGSKRHVGRGILVESSKKVAPWREDVKHAALAALDDVPDWDRTATSVGVSTLFWLPRPAGHYRTGQRRNEVKASSPRWPATYPDLDKLVRSTMDALATAGVFANDSRVVELLAEKHYADPTGLRGRATVGADIILFRLHDEAGDVVPS